MEYACNIDFTLFKHLYNFDSDSSVKGVRGIIIVPDFTGGIVKIYIHDEAQNKIFSYHNYINIGNLRGYLNKEPNKQKTFDRYARFTENLYSFFK
jgi:hypothetical protein